MLLSELDMLVRKEQHEERIRVLERERLIQFIRQQQGAKPLMHRRIIAWLGTQMVKWGGWLQRYGLNPPSPPPTVRVR